MPRPALTAGLAALALAAAPSLAAAGNWTLGGSISERLAFDSNLTLESDEDGDGAGSLSATTALGLTAGYDARRTTASLSSGVSLRQFLLGGEDEDDIDLSGITDPSLSGTITRFGKGQSVTAGFSAARRPVAFTRLEEGLPAGSSEATETRLGLNAGWSVNASRRDSLSLSGSLTARRFSDEGRGLTPSTSIGVNGGWSRILTPRTNAGANAGISRFTSDGVEEDSETWIASAGANLGTRLTRRHTLSASAGASWREGESTTTLPTFFGPIEIVEDQSGPSFNGALSLAWAGTRRTSGSFTAAQALESTTDGGLANTTRLAASFSHQLTRRDSLSLGASAVRSVDADDDGGGASQAMQLNASLGRRVTRNWSASLGGGLSFRRDEDDDARSLGAFFQVSRPLVLNR